MSLGTPVIGTNIRGVNDLLAHNSGIIFPVGDSEKLACALASVIDDPQMAQKIAKKGQDRVLKYDLHHIIKLHESLYTEALSSNPKQINE